MANKFKKGDLVIVISGSGRGKIGNIIELKGFRVKVSGVAIRKIHKKPSNNNKGYIESKEASIDVSNISHCISSEKTLTRVGFALEEGEKKGFLRKYRVLKKTGNKL